jgi:hypothetical protein
MQYTHLLYPTYYFVVSLLFVHIFWVWNSKGEFQLRLYFYALSKQGNSEFFNNKLEKYHWENLHYCGYKYICTLTNIDKHVFLIYE